RKIILNDKPESTRGNSSYRTQFVEAFGVDPDKLTASQLADQIAQAISDYMRTLKSRRTTAYDRFIQANALDGTPVAGEDSKSFAARLLAKIAKLEKSRALRL